MLIGKILLYDLKPRKKLKTKRVAVIYESADPQ